MIISKYIANHKGLIRFLIIFNLCLIAERCMIYKNRQARHLRNESTATKRCVPDKELSTPSNIRPLFLPTDYILMCNPCISFSTREFQNRKLSSCGIVCLTFSGRSILAALKITCGCENLKGLNINLIQSIAELNANTNMLQQVEQIRREHPEVDISSILPDVPKTEAEAREYVRDRVSTSSSGTFYPRFAWIWKNWNHCETIL